MLGEVYGRVEELRRLGLVIRRVRSNLDDERAFSRRVEYVPRRVEFDIARSEILKLLVRPLYGDKPEVGIRELLQNSVDAVRELWDLQEQNPALRAADLIEQESDVVLWLDEPDETGRATFTITDRGVGMTEEVITDYFLKVGASYRHSDAWAKQHERTDEKTAAGEDTTTPKSRVLRSGRFGIGALAAFLLGDEIEVSTRHVNAPKGIRFTTRLESEAIELRYVEGLKVGTTVRVLLSPEHYSELLGTPKRFLDLLDEEEQMRARQLQVAWDWYCLSSPSVLRQLGRGREVLPQEHNLPRLGQDLPPGWFEVTAAGYRAVYCSLRRGPGLVCNGIEVRDMDDDGGDYSIVTDNEGEEYASVAIRVNHPLVSVFDPDGKLPLNLTRSRLTEEDDLVKEVSKARLRYFLAYLIVTAPTEFESMGAQGVELFSEWAPQWPLCPLFYTADGASLAEPLNIISANIKTALVCVPEASPFNSLLLDRDKYDATFLTSPKYFPDYKRNYFPIERSRIMSLTRGFNLLSMDGYLQRSNKKTSARVLTTSALGKRLLNDGRARNSYHPGSIVEEWSNRQWMLLTRGFPPPTLINLKSLPEDISRISVRPGAAVAAEWFVEGDTTGHDAHKPSELAALWKEIIRQPVIPYDLRERRRRLAHAYEVLAPYIEKIERDARVEAGAAKKGRARRGRGKKR